MQSETLSRPDRVDTALQPQDLAVTILGAYLRRPGQRVWSGGMVEILGEFGFSTEAARAALSRLVTRGLLERHREGRLVFYTLSSRAHELLAEGDRRIFTFGRGAPAADAWTVVWHTIPEDRRVERAQLAQRLRFLGFGSVQDATWIAASDREQEIRALLRALDVEQHASMLIGRIARGTEQALLLSGAWDMGDLARRYRAFVGEYGMYVDARPERRAGRAPGLHDAHAHAAHVPRFPVRRSRAAGVARARGLRARGGGPHVRRDLRGARRAGHAAFRRGGARRGAGRGRPQAPVS